MLHKYCVHVNFVWPFDTPWNNKNNTDDDDSEKKKEVGKGQRKKNKEDVEEFISYNLCARESYDALFTILQKYYVETVFNFVMNDHDSFTSFQLDVDSHHYLLVSFFQTIGGVMFLTLSPPQIASSQILQHFRFSETQAICGSCFARQSPCSISSLTPACPGQ